MPIRLKDSTLDLFTIMILLEVCFFEFHIEKYNKYVNVNHYYLIKLWGAEFNDRYWK